MFSTLTTVSLPTDYIKENLFFGLIWAVFKRSILVQKTQEADNGLQKDEGTPRRSNKLLASDLL